MNSNVRGRLIEFVGLQSVGLATAEFCIQSHISRNPQAFGKLHFLHESALDMENSAILHIIDPKAARNPCKRLNYTSEQMFRFALLTHYYVEYEVEKLLADGHSVILSMPLVVPEVRNDGDLIDMEHYSREIRRATRECMRDDHFLSFNEHFYFRNKPTSIIDNLAQKRGGELTEENLGQAESIRRVMEMRAAGDRKQGNGKYVIFDADWPPNCLAYMVVLVLERLFGVVSENPYPFPVMHRLTIAA